MQIYQNIRHYIIAASAADCDEWLQKNIQGNSGQEIFRSYWIKYYGPAKTINLEGKSQR